MVTLLVHGAYAQTTGPVVNGLKWLNTQILSDGKLGNEAQSIATPLQARAEVAQTLQLLASTPASLLTSISSEPDASTEYLARKIITLATAKADTSALMAQMLNRINVDGGFGGAPGYASNVLDTSLALLALKQADRTDGVVAALAYLQSVQGTDGSFQLNGRIDLYSSIYALAAYRAHASAVPLTASIQVLTTYLMAQQSSPGSWNSSVFLSCLAYENLHDFIPAVPTATAVQTYLLNAQLPDGSWGGDPYQTALALRALSISQYVPADPSLAIIKGKLLESQTGFAVAGVRVVLVGSKTVELTTGADGNFSFTNQTPGNYSLSFSLANYTSLSATTKVNAGQVMDLGVLKLSKISTATTATIYGVVSDALSGAPVPGVLVSGATFSTVTDMNGSYQFVNVLAGDVPLTVSKLGYKTVNNTIRVAAGATAVYSPKISASGNSSDVTSTSIFGQVMDAGSNQVLAGVDITIVDAAGPHTLKSDANGKFVQGNVLKDANGMVSMTFKLGQYLDTNTVAFIDGQSTVDMGQIRMRKVKAAVLLPQISIARIDRKNAITNPQSLELSGFLNVTLQNTGTADVPAGIKLLAFNDTNKNRLFDGNIDLKLGSASLASSIAPGQTVVVQVPVSGILPFRDAPIIVWADSEQGLVQISKDDNLKSSADFIEIKPDSTLFQPKLKWQWAGGTTMPDYNQVEMAPLVMPAGKGSKSSIIIFASFRHPSYRDGILRIVNGKDGSEVVTVTDPAYRISSVSHMAAADIDGSGEITIIAQKADNGLIAFSSTGAVKWMVPGTQFVSAWHGGGISIADLDGDGKAEIIYGKTVFNYDGTLRWNGGGDFIGDNYQRGYADVVAPYSIVADINRTGRPAVIAGASAYDADGRLLWQNNAVGDGFTAVANFTGDRYPQIVSVNSGKVHLLDHNGAIIWGPVYLPGGGHGGVPVIADMDGDGIPEIGIAGAFAYTVFGADGSIKWNVPTYDISSATGSSVFDFAGDHKAKVVYADQFNLKVYDSASAKILFSIPNTSDTSFEMAVVADVDNDGHADLIVPQSSGSAVGLRIYQDVNNAWVGVRSIWNQHSYHITNINDDGTVPRVEKNSWEVNNNYRLNARVDISATAAPDVTASFIRINDQGGVKSSGLTVRIGNAGLLPIAAGTPIAFYSGQAGGGNLLGTAVTGVDLNTNEYQDVTLNYSGSMASIKTLAVVADDDGKGAHTLSDFDISNNTVSFGLDGLAGSFAIAVNTDASSYPSNTNVQLTATVKNLGSFDNNAQVQFIVQTIDGVNVAVLPKQVVKIAATAQSQVLGVWNTGSTIAGKYQVLAQLLDANGVAFTQAQSAFTIGSGNTVLTAKLSTDKTSYGPADTVQLSDVISNATQNLPVDNIQVVTTVSNPDGSVRFSKTETLAQLPAANSKNYAYSLTLNGAAPGQYAVKVIATAGSTTVQSVASFVVTASSSNGSGLTGTVAVNPAQVAVGSALALNFSASNQGNSALTNQVLSVNIIDPVGQKVVAQFPYTSTIAIGGTFSGSTTWTAAGSVGSTYVAALTATFGANTVTLAQANFTLAAPQIKLNTVIDTDKSSYAPTDIIKLHDRLTNATSNQAANNLQVVVTVKNPDGSTRFTKTETVISLAANAAQDYNYSINLSAAPAGQYTTSVVVSIAGNTVLSQASGVFTVASTASTGSGLKGSITASAPQVSVGNLISFPFNVTNEGNAALTDLPLTVSITDATQKVIASFPYKTTLAMTASFAGNTDWTSAGTAGAQYTAVLSAKVGSNTLMLGQVSFTLTSSVVSLTIKQAATPWQNVLVYSACKRAADELLGKCAATKFPTENAATLAQCDTGRAGVLDTVLANQGISHTISTDATTFLTQLRSGNYSTYWISNGASALPEPAASELLAAVKRGQGFMLDSLVTATNPQLAQCSGVTNNGAYATALQQLSLSGGVFSGADLAGPATQTKLATAGGTVEATLKGTATSPGIVSANYGNGKTLAFGFDWNDTLKAQGSENRWSLMIKQGLDYLTPAAADLNALLPGDISTLSSTITNAGAAQPVRIVQSLPAGSVIKSSTPAATIGSNGNGDVTATWNLTAASAADTIVSVRWQAPVSAGTYNANLALSMVSGGNATPYKSQDQAIKVQSASQINAQTITLIQGLSLSTPAQLAQRTAIIDLLNQVNTAMSSNSMDKALRLLITVQAKLKNIETGVGPASKSLANLIAVVERQMAR
ncbi:carboxypeptidase-like regulatory domain-containing protein [Undibacterium sp. KW1]|uniref:carboxypeptidase-like regulatory domain-containing protein n=1 Tax=Undibacterium sp. KW1 TaxID=2058624 RepID=UPI00138A37D4|nr:carboxypeptidase-like regulatory domain-containing protein [Undibacterium sp. KW1]